MYSKELQIQPADCGFRQEIRLTALLEHLQEAAGEAAARLGASVPQILPQGFTWMLVKYRMRADRLPCSGERIALRTWHYPHGRLYSLRAFELHSGESRIVRADSAWVLVDLKRRKPFQIEKGLPFIFEEKNPPIPFEFEKVQPCGEGPWTSSLGVEESDMDENGHVNHVRYLDWAVATLPPDWFISRTFRGFDAEFHGESRFGEVLETVARPESGTGEFFACLHGILRPADGAELFRMRTIWA
mgnify:CR=1 FL=1